MPYLSEQHSEVAARGRVGDVGPEQKGEPLARDGLGRGGDAVDQSASLAARHRDGLSVPHQRGRPEQGDAQRGSGGLGRG
jgi:hypothetical protein